MLWFITIVKRVSSLLTKVTPYYGLDFGCFRLLTTTAIVLLVTLIFCEVLIYPLTIKSCSWPEIKSHDGAIKVMLLADTHLLGQYRGHWFDKLRREWQMYRAFQTAVAWLQPDVIVFLGDLLDEGQWATVEQYKTYVGRFLDLFEVSSNIKILTVPGNHDVGFHYVMSEFLVDRFKKSFGSSLIHLVKEKGVNYVLVNSMALENDGCGLCEKARRQLNKIAKRLDCQIGGKCLGGRPVLLQHFPMYRKSDLKCNESDEAPPDVKADNFRENWECLSQEASELIYDKLNPRVIFNGHTHHGCHTVHRKDIHEYTIPSFSWRNKNNPTFALAVFTETENAVAKCQMPKETTVIWTYLISWLISATWVLIKYFNYIR